MPEPEEGTGPLHYCEMCGARVRRSLVYTHLRSHGWRHVMWWLRHKADWKLIWIEYAIVQICWWMGYIALMALIEQAQLIWRLLGH